MVNLKDDPEPAYQLRRYAWSAKLPLSILTDFEEFAVYDCRVRPHQADKPSKARTKYWRYTDYADHWDEIASIFSYDARKSMPPFSPRSKPGARASRGTSPCAIPP